MSDMSDATTVAGPLTVDAVACFVAGEDWHRIRPSWPPDVFGIAAAILAVSGRYVDVVRPVLSSDWATEIARIASSWRFELLARESAPSDVQQAWERLVGARSCEVQTLRENRDLVTSLLLLLAASDEACRDFLGPEADRGRALGYQLARNRFRSLCRHVDPSRARVLQGRQAGHALMLAVRPRKRHRA